jgi:hypothetical protein
MCVYGFVFVRTDVCYFIMDILFIQWKLANQTLRGTKELFRIWQVIAILSDMYYEDFFLQFGQFNNALIFFVIETHRASALYHFDQLPIDPITNVCLQQEKWLSGGKTFDMLCLFCRVMNWFVREKDDYMFLYENYYLCSYIIDISVDFEPHLYK